MQKNNSDLFFVCSLIEYIGRKTLNERKTVVDRLGLDTIAVIYKYADIAHCEPIDKVADEWIEEAQIPTGKFDNVGECRYRVPDYWTIGEVFERLIEDCFEDGQAVQGIWEVYHSWIEEHISNYNSDFYYQPRDYIAACYKERFILD